MNLFYLSRKNLQNKPLATFLSVLLLTMGVGIISGLVILNQRLKEKFEKNINGIDMVVGAKGSPLQLILSSVYHIDYPTGNIKLSEADSIAKHPLVKSTIKLGYGDSYKGFRIVGTTHGYVNHYQAKIQDGKLWQKPYEATVGNTVAKKLDLKIGDTFTGSHGLIEGGEEHAEHQYKVVGVFENSNSVLDQLVLTNIETVWNVHDYDHDAEHKHHDEEEHNHDHDAEHKHHNEKEHNHDHDTEHKHHEEEEHNHNHDAEHKHHDEEEHNHNHDAEHKHHDEEEHNHNHDAEEEEKEITAMFVKFRNPMAMMSLPRMINEETSMQSAMPAIEINRLFSLMGVGADTLQMIALAIMFVSGISVFISLFNSLKDRKYELALMRTLGASQLKLFLLIIGEGLILSVVGFIAGIVLSRVGLFFIAQSMAEKYHYDLNIWTFLPEEIYLFGVTILIGFLASCIPAIQAFKTNISETLAEN